MTPHEATAKQLLDDVATANGHHLQVLGDALLLKRAALIDLYEAEPATWEALLLRLRGHGIKGADLDGFTRGVKDEAAARRKVAEPQRSGGPSEPEPDEQPAPAAPSCTLDEAHEAFKRWLGDDYDFDALCAVLAAAAAEQLPGDPLWLLVVSGPGAAKTETVQALRGAGAHVVSTISSEAALLSGTPKKQKAADATGGLLRKVGDRGILVIKDVTSILSMNRDTRNQLLAALREIHDGHWSRDMGTDGGKTLSWAGRVVVVGAVTTAWDQAHAVVATMGDRFVLVRFDSTVGRDGAGLRAVRNTGDEQRMREELAAAAAGVLAGMSTEPTVLTEEEEQRLVAAADLVTRARTGVEYDYRGDVIDAHAPEMPTRFAKQLVQLFRGGVAIGINRTVALNLAIRCARDSMPPLRLEIIDDTAANPHSATHEIRRRLEKPRATVDRQLQALHMLGVLACDEEEVTFAGKPASRWYYRLAAGIDPVALSPLPDLSPHSHMHTEKERGEKNGEDHSDISGKGEDRMFDPRHHPPHEASGAL